MNQNRTSILDMDAGAFKERADYEMARVIDNILDPNTDPTKKRKLVLTFEFTPDSERKSIGVNLTVKSTLAATTPVSTSMCVVGSPATGEVQVVEMVPQIPGQQSMDGEYQDEPKVLKFKQA
jgi:hypothetical protein